MMYKVLILAIFVVVGEAAEGDSLQCDEDSEVCVCVDKDGNPVTQPSRNIKSCNCLVERHEALENNEGLIGGFVPQCSEDGRYQKVQCVASTGQCFCVDPETGDPTSAPTRGIPNC